MGQPPSAEEVKELEVRLDLLERRQRAITNKETLRELQYEAAELRWRLGLMSDEEFEEFEEFHDSFTFDF
jgi:hypothetical protein